MIKMMMTMMMIMTDLNVLRTEISFSDESNNFQIASLTELKRLVCKKN